MIDPPHFLISRSEIIPPRASIQLVMALDELLNQFREIAHHLCEEYYKRGLSERPLDDDSAIHPDPADLALGLGKDKLR